MPLRPVPWAIGNGAENSVELARAAAFIGSSGSTGVVDPVDFGVTELPTPGDAVRVSLGTGVIRSTYPGAVGQSYVVQEQSHTDVPVAATGSSGGATKYVYVLITDTQYGGQTPPSVEEGPYNEYAVSTTLPQNQPYLLLAKIDQPASTATIRDEHITDLRDLAMPKRETLMFGRPRVASDGAQNLGRSVEDGGEFFPGNNDSGPSSSQNSFDVDVPEWATRILIDASWMSVRYAADSNPRGRYWIEYGDEYRSWTWPNKQQYEFATQQFGFNATGSGDVSNSDWRLMSSQHLPKKLRGKRITIAFKAGRSDSGAASQVSMTGLGGLGMHLTFVQTSLDPKNQGEAA